MSYRKRTNEVSEEPPDPADYRLAPRIAIGTLTPLPHREIIEARKALIHRPAHATLSRAIIATPVAAAIAVITAIVAVSGKSRHAPPPTARTSRRRRLIIIIIL